MPNIDKSGYIKLIFSSFQNFQLKCFNRELSKFPAAAAYEVYIYQLSTHMFNL